MGDGGLDLGALAEEGATRCPIGRGLPVGPLLRRTGSGRPRIEGFNVETRGSLAHFSEPASDHERSRSWRRDRPLTQGPLRAVSPRNRVAPSESDPFVDDQDSTVEVVDEVAGQPVGESVAAAAMSPQRDAAADLGQRYDTDEGAILVQPTEPLQHPLIGFRPPGFGEDVCKDIPTEDALMSSASVRPRVDARRARSRRRFRAGPSSDHASLAN